MKIISEPTSKKVILKKYNTYFRTMIKCVADVEKQIIAIDGELHADLEELLLENNSSPQNLWGINLYLEKEKENWIEYTALINIRPSLDNRGMEVESKVIRDKIRNIIENLIIV